MASLMDAIKEQHAGDTTADNEQVDFTGGRLRWGRGGHDGMVVEGCHGVNLSTAGPRWYGGWFRRTTSP